MDYYFLLIDDVGLDLKVFFCNINCFFYRKFDKFYLLCMLVSDFVNNFVNFFIEKIVIIKE